MGIENRPNWRRIAINGLTAAAVLSPLAYNFDTVARVAHYLATGNPVDCSQSPENDAQNPYKSIKGIAVFGAGQYRDPETGVIMPSKFERRRLDAAAYLYVNMRALGNNPKVKLLDGVTADPTVDKRYIIHQVRLISRGMYELSDEDVVTDGASVDTWSNAQELDGFVDGDVIGITDAFHGLRAGLYSCKQKRRVRMMTVEEINRLYNPPGLPQILDDDMAPGMRARVFKEALEVAAFVYIPTVPRILKNVDPPAK